MGRKTRPISWVARALATHLYPGAALKIVASGPQMPPQRGCDAERQSIELEFSDGTMVIAEMACNGRPGGEILKVPPYVTARGTAIGHREWVICATSSGRNGDWKVEARLVGP